MFTQLRLMRLQSRRRMIAVAATLAAGIAFASPRAVFAEDAPPAATADPLWAASFKDLTGTLQKFDNLKGKIAIVYFWATWCEPCQKEAPQLRALYEKYREQGVEVVGIAMDNADKVKDFAAKNNLTFKVVYGGREAIQLSKDLGNSVGGIPFLVVIGRDGKIVERLIGETKDGRVEGIITPLLGG